MKERNQNEWQFVGDVGSSQYTVANCFIGPLCVVEFVHSLFYTLKPELYVIRRYVFSEVQVNSFYYGSFVVLIYFENKLHC